MTESDLKDTIMVDDSCGFCAEYYHFDSENNLLQKLVFPHTGLRTRVVMQSSYFWIAPTIGGFIKNYLLIISKMHYSCLGKMPVRALEDLDSVLNSLAKYLHWYNETGFLAFEHGAVSCLDQSGGCVNHVHLHVVPLENPVYGIVKKYKLHPIQIDSYEELRSIAQKGMPYLYFQDVNHRRYLVTGEMIPSQFMRKILANIYDVPNRWDWRQYPCMELLTETIRGFSEYLKATDPDKGGGYEREQCKDSLLQ